MASEQALQMYINGEAYSPIQPKDASLSEARGHYQAILDAYEETDGGSLDQTILPVVMHARSMVWLIDQLEALRDE